MKIRHFLEQELGENLLVNKRTNHVRIVVQGQQRFDHLHEHPEGFFLSKFIDVSTHYLQKTSHYKVEALAVANSGISDCVGKKNVFNCVSSPLFLKERFAAKSSRKVNFDLMNIWIWKGGVSFLQQRCVVRTGTGLAAETVVVIKIHLVLRSTQQQPSLLSILRSKTSLLYVLF